jgi:predicted nucleotidyltransferase component of viral defense system
MATFYLLDDSAIGSDPSGILDAQFSTRLQGVENRPNIFAELCVLDMFLAIYKIRDSYYQEKLILKGGHSVRTYVPLRAHRFSYDLDFNIYRDGGYTFRDIQTLSDDLNTFAGTRRSQIRSSVTRNNQRFHWITLNYRQSIEEKYGVRIPEEPKIEICKDCRTIRSPVENVMVTTVDSRLLGVNLPHVKQLDLNEQLSDKLYVIGVTARQRRHFDIFDSRRIMEYNADKLDWKLVRKSFHALMRRENTQSHIKRARRLIQLAIEDTNTTRRLESGTFEPFNFKEAAQIVSDSYSKVS